MNFYAPLFSKIVDSSIWTEPDYVVKVFLTMIAKQDRDNIVRGTAFNISCWAKKTEAETIDALKILCAPDTKRLEPQPYEGRRLEKVTEGYLVLNGEYYQKEMQKINRRSYLASWQRDRRQASKQADQAASDCPPSKPPTKPKSQIVIPDNLKSEAFSEAWSKWLEHLKQKKSIPTDHAQDLQLRKLSKMGEARAIGTIYNCIEKGWKGIYESDGQAVYSQPQATAAKMTEAEILRQATM